MPLETLLMTFIAVSILAIGWFIAMLWLSDSKRLIRWRRSAGMTSVLFFLAVIVNVAAIATILAGMTAVSDVLFYVILLVLLVAFIQAAVSAKQLANWQAFAVMPGRARAEPMQKPKPERIKATGIPALDQLLLEPLPRTSLLIYGPEGTHPWRLAQHFIADGLVKGEACIYVATTRPPELILEQIGELFRRKYGRPIEKFRANFGIVDCFTPFASFSERDAFPQPADYIEQGWNYATADPRDLNSLHISIAKVKQMLGEKKIRVVYDMFSPIAEFSDADALYQYLLHQIAFEDKFSYMSMYLLRREEAPVEWLKYLVGGEIKLAVSEGERTIQIIKMPARYREGTFKLDSADRIVRRAAKPKFAKEAFERFGGV
ncbi:MAG: RAD55 family ATPase [Candidatus Aenigmatarchaeota archaeon]